MLQLSSFNIHTHTVQLEYSFFWWSEKICCYIRLIVVSKSYKITPVVILRNILLPRFLSNVGKCSNGTYKLGRGHLASNIFPHPPYLEPESEIPEDHKLIQIKQYVHFLATSVCFSPLISFLNLSASA